MNGQGKNNKPNSQDDNTGSNDNFFQQAVDSKTSPQIDFDQNNLAWIICKSIVRILCIVTTTEIIF
jgi:hypothetical protein